MGSRRFLHRGAASDNLGFGPSRKEQYSEQASHVVGQKENAVFEFQLAVMENNTFANTDTILLLETFERLEAIGIA